VGSEDDESRLLGIERSLSAQDPRLARRLRGHRYRRRWWWLCWLLPAAEVVVAVVSTGGVLWVIAVDLALFAVAVVALVALTLGYLVGQLVRVSRQIGGDGSAEGTATPD